MRPMWGGLLRVASAVVAASLLAGPASAQSTGKTIKFLPEADLRSLDPIWTTAYITRNHGYMVYDTLFALDEHLKPQPQMVDTWKLSDDKLTYIFTLRDGLKWHDGTPVRSADCIASLARWMKRDSLGQAMAQTVGEMKAADDKTFSIVLKKPFPLLLDAIGKLSSNVPFMMPERIAKTDANTADHRCHRLGPVQIREGGMGSRQQGDLCQEPGLRAARRSRRAGPRAARW